MSLGLNGVYSSQGCAVPWYVYALQASASMLKSELTKPLGLVQLSRLLSLEQSVASLLHDTQDRRAVAGLCGVCRSCAITCARA
eukprot:2082954-Amphidinium_carterae.1